MRHANTAIAGLFTLIMAMGSMLGCEISDDSELDAFISESGIDDPATLMNTGGYSLNPGECTDLGCDIQRDPNCNTTWRCKCGSGSRCIDEGNCDFSDLCCGTCCGFSPGCKPAKSSLSRRTMDSSSTTLAL